MNIKCNYCGSEFDETLEKCPNCGAVNSNVKRSTIDQPTTIEELKDWYKSKGLPPYETTRFFIGEDYKAPRAFGIFKDEKSEKIIVYKNKDNGERAVRYEGSDEAYAVNEIFMRLKDEILEQKLWNISSGNVPSTLDSSPAKNEGSLNDDALKAIKNYSPPSDYGRTKGSGNKVWIWLVVAIAAILCIGIGVFKASEKNIVIDTGYYEYSDAVYYHLSQNDDLNWLAYNSQSDEWNLVSVKDTPLVKPRQARKYFVSKKDFSKLGCSDVLESGAYKDFCSDYSVDTGYYCLDNEYYYHNSEYRTSDWYKYLREKDDWEYVSEFDLPENLKHQYLAEEYVYNPNWDTETNLSDIADSKAYPGLLDEEDSYNFDGSYDYSNNSNNRYNSDGSNYFDDDDDYDDDDEYNYSHGSYDSSDNYEYNNDSSTTYDSDDDSWWSSDDDSWDWDSDSSWDWDSGSSWDSDSSDWGSDW